MSTSSLLHSLRAHPSICHVQPGGGLHATALYAALTQTFCDMPHVHHNTKDPSNAKCCAALRSCHSSTWTPRGGHAGLDLQGEGTCTEANWKWLRVNRKLGDSESQAPSYGTAA